MPIPEDVVTRMHVMSKISPRGIIFSNQKHIDDLDDEFDSHISDKGIPGVNDTNTNTDIKCKKTTKSVKSNNDDKLLDLPDLEDIVRTADDDNDNDDDDDDDDDDECSNMPGLQERGINDDKEDEEDYTYTNNKGIPGVTTRSGRVVKQVENYKDADYSYNQINFGDFAFSES